MATSFEQNGCATTYVSGQQPLGHGPVTVREKFVTGPRTFPDSMFWNIFITVEFKNKLLSDVL